MAISVGDAPDALVDDLFGVVDDPRNCIFRVGNNCDGHTGEVGMRFGLRHLTISSVVTAVALCCAPAAAERLYTYWKLDPITSEGRQVATYGSPFATQRLLPVRLVELQEPILVKRGNRTIEKGALLYLVFNKEGTLAYCTSKDFTTFGAKTGWGIPIADTRPCFLDSDNDGKFEAAFFVYDEFGTPPTARGSTGKAKPVTPSAYAEVDPRRYRDDLKLNYTFEGSKVDNTQIAAATAGSGADFPWSRVKLVQTPQGHVAGIFNTLVRVNSIEDGRLSIDIAYKPDVYIYAEDYGVYATELPAFLSRSLPPATLPPTEMEAPPLPTEEPPAPPGANGSP